MLFVDDLEREVRVVAERHPDFEYTPDEERETSSCSYLPNTLNEEGCIIGVALRRLGVSGDYLKAAEGYSASSLIASVVNSPDVFDGEIEDGLARLAYRWFDLVQQEQDSGTPWGDAVRFADGNLELT